MTTPTLEQRLDAAAEAYVLAGGYKAITDIPRANRMLARKNVEIICRAFAPEHFKDTSKEGKSNVE